MFANRMFQQIDIDVVQLINYSSIPFMVLEFFFDSSMWLRVILGL